MRALGELGFLLAGAADYRQAAGFLEEALRLADAASDRAGQVLMLSRLCIVSTNILRLDRAAQFGKRALSLARETKEERLVAQALDALKQVVLQLGDAGAFEEIADELAPIHERLQDLWLLQFVHFERAYVWAGLGRWEDAFDELRRSLDINRRIGDRGNEPLLLSSLGRFHGLRGEYGEALELGRRGTALAAEMGHAEWGSFSEMTLGATLLDLHAFEEADRHLTRSTESAEIGGALLHLVRAAALLSWCRWRLGDREGAEGWAERAQALFTQVTTPPGTAYLAGSDAYAAVARLRLRSGDPTRARALVGPVVAAGETSGWVEATARGSVVLGRCELALGRTDDGERHLVHAVESARAAMMPAAELEARAALRKLYQEQDRRDEAAVHDAVSRSVVETLSGRIVDESIRAEFVTEALAELEEGSP
jgi:tetratricopeptide (TPR) repeat protein